MTTTTAFTFGHFRPRRAERVIGFSAGKFDSMRARCSIRASDPPTDVWQPSSLYEGKF